MDQEPLETLTKAAKTLKTEKAFNNLSQMLIKIAIKAVLNAKFDEHFVYSKYR